MVETSISFASMGEKKMLGVVKESRKTQIVLW